MRGRKMVWQQGKRWYGYGSYCLKVSISKLPFNAANTVYIAPRSRIFGLIFSPRESRPTGSQQSIAAQDKPTWMRTIHLAWPPIMGRYKNGYNGITGTWRPSALYQRFVADWVWPLSIIYLFSGWLLRTNGHFPPDLVYRTIISLNRSNLVWF